MMFSRQLAKLRISIYQLFFQTIRGCDVHVRACLLSDDGTGQDGFGGNGLTPPFGLSRTPKMVAQQVGQIKRVIRVIFHLAFSVFHLSFACAIAVGCQMKNDKRQMTNGK
jgi:hypothetical protein